MWHKWFKLKGALSDFTPTGPRPYFEISAPHVRTQPWQLRSRKQLKMTQEHIQTKANTDKLCEIKQNQRYSPIKKKQRNLGVRFEPFPLLDFSPPLESCSDIYASPTSCLIVILLFNVLFLWYNTYFFPPSLSVYSQSANIRPVHSNWALSSPCHYKTSPLTADWLQLWFGTRSDAVVKSVFQKSV